MVNNKTIAHDRGISPDFDACNHAYIPLLSADCRVICLRFTRSRWTCDTAELFIRYGCDIQAVDNEGNTPLHRAAESDRDDIASILLDRGVEAEALDW